jgi:integrase
MKEQKRVRGIFEKVPSSGVFWIRFVDCEGKYHREKVGSKSAATKLYHLRKAQATEGVKLPPTLRRRVVPFAELCDDAVAYVEKEYARPADDIARIEMLKTWFPGSAEAATPDEIERKLEAAAEEKKWGPSTRNHYHNVLSLTFRLALRAGKIKESPIHGKVRKLPEDNSRVRFLTPAEEKKLRETVRGNPAWADHEPELDLALNTGLRRGSMYENLVWENVDLQERTATIPRTKNGKMVVVPLNDDAMRALRAFRSRCDGTGRVVRNGKGEPLKWPKIWFAPAVRAAGIKNFRWHDCRHTYASRLRQTGTPLGNIAELLGHKGLAMAMRYAHLSISNLHEAVARIANSTPVAPEPISETAAIPYVN